MVFRQDLSTPAAPTDSVYDAISADQPPAPVGSAPKAMSSQSDGNSPDHDVVDIVDSGRLSQHRWVMCHYTKLSMAQMLKALLISTVFIRL